MSKLSGKIAVITGGNSGIGLATAKLFASEGAQVVITGRRKDELDKAVAVIGKGAIGVQSDVAKMADLDKLFTEAKGKFGHIDVLFANAGVIELAPLGTITEQSFDKQFSINVRGLLFTVQKALPLMKEGASIILNSSVVNSKGMGAMSVYSATKAAVRSFARTWTTDLKDRKIRVNVVSPGPIETPIYSTLGLPEQQMQDFAKSVEGQVPMGRFGQADEIAHAVLFFASSDSSYITGVDLQVDGGMTAV